MEDNRLYLKEEYGIRDSLTPVGYVIIRTEDGKIIYKGHNMVVASGRSLLKSIFMGDEQSITFTDLFAYIGDNPTMAAANDTWDSSVYTEITEDADEVTINGSGTYYRLRTVDDEPDSDPYVQVATVDADEFMRYYSSKASSGLVAPDTDTLYYIDKDSYIHMGIRYAISDDIAKQISTFGLAFKDGGNTSLFSRIVFPARTISKNTPIVIDYYLYF